MQLCTHYCCSPPKPNRIAAITKAKRKPAGSCGVFAGPLGVKFGSIPSQRSLAELALKGGFWIWIFS